MTAAVQRLAELEAGTPPAAALAFFDDLPPVAVDEVLGDRLPVLDVFRRVDDNTLLGLMDLRGLPDPYLFVLRRDA